MSGHSDKRGGLFTKVTLLALLVSGILYGLHLLTRTSGNAGAEEPITDTTRHSTELSSRIQRSRGTPPRDEGSLQSKGNREPDEKQREIENLAQTAREALREIRETPEGQDSRNRMDALMEERREILAIEDDEARDAAMADWRERQISQRDKDMETKRLLRDNPEHQRLQKVSRLPMMRKRLRRFARMADDRDSAYQRLESAIDDLTKSSEDDAAFDEAWERFSKIQKELEELSRRDW